MKNLYIFLIENNKKSIILFIILNILLVFVETFSIALIPSIIDFSISNNPILPQYFIFRKFIKLLIKIFFIRVSFFNNSFILKNIYVIFLVAFHVKLFRNFSNKLKKNFSNYILMLL